MKQACVLAGWVFFVAASATFAQTPQGVIVEKDVVYGQCDGVDLKLDLAIPPEQEGTFPVVVCIHGGAWQLGNKSDYDTHIRLLASYGYVAASVGYRLAPQHQWPAQIQDVKCAVRYLRKHAEEFSIDPNRIAALGDSAGAHLALLVGLMNDNDGFNSAGGNAGQSSEVRAVINFSGPSELATWRVLPAVEEEFFAYHKRDSDGILEDLLGTADRSDAVMTQASPVHYVDSGDPPILTFHGTADPIVPIGQAKLLHRALEKAGVQHTLHPVEGAGHAFTPAQSMQANQQALAFLEQTLKGKAPAAPAVKTKKTHVSVPMQDGTKLATDVHFPSPEGGPWPVVLVRSTYGRIGGPLKALLNEGLAVVAQDVRGMGGSEGDKYVFHPDGWRPGLSDGADTVAWILEQPWCNGKIGTWGGSALGITQMLLAPTTHDVAAQFIEIAPSNLYEDMFYQGGVFRKSILEGWLPMIGQAHRLDEYKRHPTYDNFWAYYDAEARAADMSAPALFVGGWFDIFQQGTLDAFLSRERHGAPGAKGNNYLIMKPSCHEETTSNDYRLQENRWSLNVTEALMDLYARFLKGDMEALKGFPKVHYYVMGADTEGAPGNEWRTADRWPPFETDAIPYYLHKTGVLSKDPPEVANAKMEFVFDPNDPFPTHGGANLLLPAGPRDQRRVSENRKDLLQFASEPLAEAMEVTGHVTVKLFVSSDAPDTDFTAKLVDIYPAGDDRQILVLDSIRRVKTRLGFQKVAPLLDGPDDIVEVVIDLQSISWIFDSGHRIGLHLSSSNYPRFEVNPNTGADFPADGAERRVARNAVHMGASQLSALVLPGPPAE